MKTEQNVNEPLPASGLFAFGDVFTFIADHHEVTWTVFALTEYDVRLDRPSGGRVRGPMIIGRESLRIALSEDRARRVEPASEGPAPRRNQAGERDIQMSATTATPDNLNGAGSSPSALLAVENIKHTIYAHGGSRLFFELGPERTLIADSYLHDEKFARAMRAFVEEYFTANTPSSGTAGRRHEKS